MVTTATDRHQHSETGHTGTADGRKADENTPDTDTDTQVPSPRRGDRRDNPDDGHHDGQGWRVMLRKDADGGLWVMVEGADLFQAADRMLAVCAAMNRTRWSR